MKAKKDTKKEVKEKEIDFTLSDIFGSGDENEKIELLNTVIKLMYSKDSIILKTETDKKMSFLIALIDIYEDTFKVGILRKFIDTYLLAMVSNKRLGRKELIEIINGLQEVKGEGMSGSLLGNID